MNAIWIHMIEHVKYESIEKKKQIVNITQTNEIWMQMINMFANCSQFMQHKFSNNILSCRLQCSFTCIELWLIR